MITHVGYDSEGMAIYRELGKTIQDAIAYQGTAVWITDAVGIECDSGFQFWAVSSDGRRIAACRDSKIIDAVNYAVERLIRTINY